MVLLQLQVRDFLYPSKDSSSDRLLGSAGIYGSDGTKGWCGSGCGKCYKLVSTVFALG